MEIEVRLFAMLRDYLPEGTEGFAFTKCLEEEMTAGQLMEELGLPRDVPAIIMAKSVQVNEGYVVKDGDVISFFPPLGGG